MAAQNYPNAYLGDEAGNRSYAFASTETVVDKDTGKTLKQILQEGGAGTGAVNTVDGIAPENGNVALLSPTPETPSGTPVPLDADTLQGHSADEFAKVANYSTDEQWTGKWWQDPETQNRYKIYSKIWVTGTLGVGNNTIQLETSIKQPVSYGGTLFLQRGDTWPFPCALDQFSSGLSTINFPNNPGTAIISLGSGYADAVSVVKAHIWMEYIKEESTGGN